MREQAARDEAERRRQQRELEGSARRLEEDRRLEAERTSPISRGTKKETV